MIYVLMLVASTSFGQASATPDSYRDAPARQDTTHYLFHVPKIRTLGFYVAPEAGVGQFTAKEFSGVAGASAMFVFNQKFALGVAAYGSVDRNFSPASVAPLYLHAAYGGLKMEYTPRPSSAVHVSFPLLVGMGQARVDSTANDGFFGFGHGGHNGHFDNDSLPNGPRDGVGRGPGFVVVQPGVRVEANLFRFAKIFVGADYRLGFQRETSTTVPSNALTGLSLTAGLKIGLFDFRLSKLGGPFKD